MLNKNIKIEFDEKYENEEFETTTLYFTGPKELLGGKYPEAVSTEISVEFPTGHPEPAYATVMYSPTKHDEESGCYTDYDWFDVDMPHEDIESLMELAERERFHSDEVKQIVVYHIQWDAPKSAKLPSEVVIDVNDDNKYLLEDIDGSADNLSDFLSDKYEYCHFGFDVKVKERSNKL